MFIPLLVLASTPTSAPAEIALKDMGENARAANLFPGEGQTRSGWLQGMRPRVCIQGAEKQAASMIPASIFCADVD